MLRAEDVCILSWSYIEDELDLSVNSCILWSIFERLLVIWGICPMDREVTFEFFFIAYF